MRLITSILLLASFFFVPPAFAESAAKPVPSRWSLDEWLAQKNRNRLMDQWLALQSSSPYEFYLSADGTSIAAGSDVTGTNQQIVNNAVRARFGAYASIVGLEGSYENLPDLKSSSADGSFHVRLLGTSVRSTYLDAHYSLKYRNENGEAVRLQGPGARLTILLIQTFGLSGSYDAHLDSTSETGQKWSGSQTEGEVFIDFERLRIFGRYTRRDDQVTSTAGTLEKRVREGLGAGLKIYF
ncbi:MAG: hypothetical protein V4760_00875 [Bdellovibrionota bacterium]